MSSSSPLRIGLHGLDSFGLYHLQQLSLRDDLELAAVSASGDLEILWPANRPPGKHHPSLPDLLREDLDAVILSDLPEQSRERAALFNSVLQAGKHVILGQPASIAPQDWAELRNTLTQTQRQILVDHPSEFDSEYRTARRVASLSLLGDLLSIRYLRFRHALPPHGPSNSAPRIPEPRWQRGLWESEALSGLSMLLSLHPQPVARVYAHAAPHHLQILLEFQHGGRGHWEIDLASPAPLSTGWFLAGTRATFSRDRTYRVTDEGEIVETPVEAEPTCQTAFYDTLAQKLSHSSASPDNISALSRLFAVFSAAQASATSKNWTQVARWE